jgi:apoptosis-inducing factor 3
MKEVAVLDSAVLVYNVDGKFFATAAKCTHFAAPLKSGVLCDKVVKCPWHGAAYSIEDGAVVESPGLDSLQTFAVRKRLTRPSAVRLTPARDTF